MDSFSAVPRRLTIVVAGALCTLIGVAILYTGSLWAMGAASATQRPPGVQAHKDARAAMMPALFVQGGLSGDVGSLVDVLIAFDSGGAHVAALSFSFNYDAGCLALALDDANRDGIPDAIRIDSAAQFFVSVQVHPNNDSLGRIDIMIVDYLPPLAALRDNAALVTIQFRIVCALDPGLVSYTHVGFAEAPPAGFGGARGDDLVGITRDGVVQIIGALPGATPTPTPTPATGSPTPTLVPTIPNTPTPVVLLDVIPAPSRLTRVDRAVIFVVDYAVLSVADQIALSIPVPEHTYFDSTASSLGWQCTAELANRRCRTTLYSAANPKTMNGRLFFAVALNWPLPTHVTQIEFTALVEVNGVVTSQLEPIRLPLLPGDPIAEPGSLALALQAGVTEVEAGRDHKLDYTLAYTNSGQAPFQALSLHLVLPLAATLHPADARPLDWICSTAEEGAANCVLAINELAPDAYGEAPFVLALPSTSLEKMAAVVVIAYATEGGHLVGSSSSAAPVRHSEESDRVTRRLFLPVVMRGRR